MTTQPPIDACQSAKPLPSWVRVPVALAVAAAAVLSSGCGGGGAFGSPPDVNNQSQTGGRQQLSFAFYQRCINPIFLLQLPIVGTGATNTCAGSGCHDSVNGTGGAFRVIPSATTVDLTDPANTPDVIRTTAMYRNFYSAQGEVALTAISQSRLITKPRVQGVLHGGGLIFTSDADPNVRLINFWMTRPAPVGQDEFSTDPGLGTCTVP